MTRTGICLMLFVLPALALATVTFERRWHWDREDVGRSVALTADGGYLVSGQTWAGGSQYGIVLARTDSFGDTTSVSYLPDVSNGSGYLCHLRGGGFATAGIRNTHKFARGFGPAGDSIWSYDSTHRGLVYALIAVSDGGCLIAGRDSMQDMEVIRLDSAGREEWSHSYDEPRVQGSSADGAAETRDGGFILCGDATDYAGSYVRLVRTNAAGETLWTQLYSGPSLRAIRQTPDDGFLAVGWVFDTDTLDALYLLRTDPNGAVIWTRNISPPGAGTRATAMNGTRDGGYIVAGSIDWSDSARIWLVKLDAGADTVWTSVVGGRGREQAVDVWQTSDGGYVIAGTSDPPSDSILLLKTDSLGLVPYGVAEEKSVPRERITLSVEPNPATGVVRVEWSLPAGSEPAALRVYDSQGRLVHSSFVIRHSSLSLGLRSMPAGVYLLRLDSDLGPATRKLVIE